MKIRLLALLIASPFCLAGCIVTPPSEGEVIVHDRHADVRIVFSDHDRVVIRDYYTLRYKSLPPGLAKKGKIPPGHARQMERWGQLPPGLEYRHLPTDLERRLEHLPEGYARIVVGSDVMIMNTRTRVIFDIIKELEVD